VWHDALMGYTVGDARGDLSFDRRDSAPYMPRCVVEDPSFSWGVDRAPGHKDAESILYEAHVKGFTRSFPAPTRPGPSLRWGPTRCSITSPTWASRRSSFCPSTPS
jgi:isoamylase